MSKKIAYCSMLTALALIFGFLEHLVALDFIAPGIKLGLANSIVLLLFFLGHKSEAVTVNIARILLGTLLFSGPVSAGFALGGAALSMLVSYFLLNVNRLSIVGVSIVGAVCHNLGQITVARLVLKTPAVFYYIPILTLCGAICGLLTGLAASLVLKRIKNIQ